MYCLMIDPATSPSFAPWPDVRAKTLSCLMAARGNVATTLSVGWRFGRLVTPAQSYLVYNYRLFMWTEGPDRRTFLA